MDVCCLYIWSYYKSYLYLQRVFHSIRFKVNKVGPSGAHFFTRI